MTGSFLDGRRLVFLGTPEPAAQILSHMLDAGCDVCEVITGPDAKRQRGSGLTPTPVKEVALARGVPVTHSMEHLRDVGDSLFGVVVAFGRIIPDEILAVVPMVNVHFSLLPRWRGAAPVERAILAGDAITGVCIMEVVAELDAGGVYASREVPVGSSTRDELMATLTAAGADELLRVLSGPVLPAVPQTGEVTYAHKIRPDEAEIDWSLSAAEIARQVRALRARTWFAGKRLLVLEVVVVDENVAVDNSARGLCDDNAVVSCGRGAVRLVRVQPEGKSAMGAEQWRRGVRGELVLGAP